MNPTKFDRRKPYDKRVPNPKHQNPQPKAPAPAAGDHTMVWPVSKIPTPADKRQDFGIRV